MMKYLLRANEKMKELGLFDKYVGCYPMLKVNDEKLNVIVYFADDGVDVWDKDVYVDAKYEVLIDIKTEDIISYGEVKPIRADKNYYSYDVRDKYSELIMTDFTRGEENAITNVKGFREFFVNNLGRKLDATLFSIEDIVKSGREAYLDYYYDELFAKALRDYLDNGVIDTDSINKSYEVIKEFYNGINFEGLLG